MIWLLFIAASQTTGAQQADVFVGCPVGATLDTAPDPRLAPLGTTFGAGLVVRCVTQRPAAPPIRPAGYRIAIGPVLDQCVASGRTSTVAGEGSGRLVTDGNSNTISVGEASASPPPTMTTSKTSGNYTSVPMPTCAAGARLMTDAGGLGADACVTQSFSPPTEPVSLLRR